MLCTCSPEWWHSKREHGTHCFVHVVTFPGIPRVIFTITVHVKVLVAGGTESSISVAC